MSAASGRERVVQPYDPRGAMCAAFVLGGVFGAVLLPLLNVVSHFAPRWFVVSQVALYIHILLPFVILGAFIGRQTGRKRTVALAAVACGVGMFSVQMGYGLHQAVGFGAGHPVHEFQLRMLIAFAMMTSLGLIAAFAARWCARWWSGVPIVQTEPARLCWACAYEAGAADPCPECGTRRADSRPLGRRMDRMWGFVQRAARPVVMTLLLLSAGYGAYRFWFDYLPTRAFVARFGPEADDFAYIDVATRTIGGSSFLGRSIGRMVNLEDGTGRRILVSFNGNSPRGLPAMQVRICAAGQKGSDWGVPGTVVADLNREQAERVIRDGLPRPLVDAIVAKADEIGWKAGGGMQNVGGQRIVVDPAPYFAEEPAMPGE